MAYQTSNDYKEKILADGTQHLLNIYIDDKKIDDSYILGFSMSPVLIENDEFCFGETPALTATLKIHQNALPDTYERFYIESGITNEVVPIGYFNVDEISKDDGFTVTFTLIDDMSKFEFNYDGSELSYPATMLEVLQDICSKAGVELGSTSFLNSDKQVSVYDSTVTARTYLGYIAEQAGGFAVIGRDGKLYIRRIGENLSEISSLVTVEDVDNMTVSEVDEMLVGRLASSEEIEENYILPLRYFAEYSWGEQFKVSRIAYEDGIQDFKKGDTTDNTIWISSDNMYIVSQEQIDNIYNEYEDFDVYSFSGTSIVDPAWDLGDIIIIDGKKVVYQGEIEYKGKFKASIESEIQAKSKEDTTVTTVSEATKIRRVQSQIDQTEATITQLVEETAEYSEKISQVEQSLESIYQQISEMEDFSRTVTSSNQVHLEDTVDGVGYLLNLTIKGSTDNFIYLAPNDELTPSDTLVPYGDHFTLVSDSVSRDIVSDEAVEYDIVLSEPLRDLDGVYDELNIDNGIITVTRRIGVNEDLSLYILSEEVTEEIGTVYIKTFDEDTYIYIKEYKSIEYSATYIIKNDYTEIFATAVELVSLIEQTAESITETVEATYATKDELIEEKSERIQTANEIIQTVSTKVGEDEVCSVISQSSEEIRIEGNRVIIISTYFILTADGEITATRGTIGGFALGTEVFSSDINGIYDYSRDDQKIIISILMGYISADDILLDVLDANSDGTLNSVDLLRMANIILGSTTNTKNVEGTFEINSNDPKNCLKVSKDGSTVVSIGLGGVNANMISTDNLICGYTSGDSTSSFSGVVLNGEDGKATFIEGANAGTIITANSITTPDIVINDGTINATGIYNNNNVTSSPNLYITSYGNFRRTTGSSQRWKTDITEEIEDRLNPQVLYDLPVKQFKYKDDIISEDDVRKGQNILGFIAEDVAEIYEAGVQYDEEGKVEMWNKEVFIPAMLKLIQEQHNDIESLKKEVEKLKGGQNEEDNI